MKVVGRVLEWLFVGCGVGCECFEEVVLGVVK